MECSETRESAEQDVWIVDMDYTRPMIVVYHMYGDARMYAGLFRFSRSGQTMYLEPVGKHDGPVGAIHIHYVTQEGA